MSIRSFFRKIAGRAGAASRSKRGANSHVNTQANKRAASKAVRCSYRARLMEELDREQHKAMVDRFFYEDHHLDIPDEIKERYE